MPETRERPHQPEPDEVTGDAVALLRSKGLRVTAQRRAVLDALDGPTHLTADEIAASVTASLGSISTQAVYDVLHTLTGADLLRRIEPAGSPTRYERRVGDNHHHLVCRHCGVVRDVPCVVGAAPCLHPSELAGFDVDEAEITFWGLCSDCRNRTNRTPVRKESHD